MLEIRAGASRAELWPPERDGPKAGKFRQRNQRGCGQLFSPDRQTKHKAGKWICSGRCRKPVTEPGSTVTSPSPIPSLQLFPSPVPAATVVFIRQHQTLSREAVLGAGSRNPWPQGTGAGEDIPKGSVLLPWRGEGWEQPCPWPRGAPSFVLGSPEGRSSAGLPREPRPILPAAGKSLHGCEEGKKED